MFLRTEVGLGGQRKDPKSAERPGTCASIQSFFFSVRLRFWTNLRSRTAEGPVRSRPLPDPGFGDLSIQIWTASEYLRLMHGRTNHGGAKLHQNATAELEGDRTAQNCFCLIHSGQNLVHFSHFRPILPDFITWNHILSNCVSLGKKYGVKADEFFMDLCEELCRTHGHCMDPNALHSSVIHALSSGASDHDPAIPKTRSKSCESSNRGP